MNSTTISFQQSTNFQFLSVCHYIINFGIFFYNKKLITEDKRNHSACVLNTLFEYIDTFEDQNDSKLKLLQRVLKGTDLYGGGKNETLDMKYVDDTYHYIISTALFSQYGNIDGYLAEIISQTDNITYSALKEMVFQKLSKYYISRDFCSSRYESYELTNLTINKVFNEYVWSMFPEPEQNIEIMDVDYIYAMTGLKIARSIQLDISNITFESYILLSQGIELQKFDNDTYELLLELFATPALFYYAFKEKEKFRSERTINLIKSDKFWTEAYDKFFHHIKFSLNKSLMNVIKKSLYNKLERELKQLKSRTFLSCEILKELCNYSNGKENLSFYSYLYKTAEWLLKIVLPERCKKIELPDLDNIFNDQFIHVQETYNEIEKKALEKILTDGKIIDDMNLNTTVYFAMVDHMPMRCSLCPRWPNKVNSDIFLLFAIIGNKRNDYYALRQENNSLSLLTYYGNEIDFGLTVGNDSSIRLDTRLFVKPIKKHDEDHKVFIQKIADIKTKQFVQGLKEYYRDPTDAELVIDFLKSLVPFYTCIQNVQSGNQGLSAFSCSLDVLSLIPIAGVAAKYSSIMWRSLINEIAQESLLTLSKPLLNRLTLTDALFHIFKSTSHTVSQQILTMGLLHDSSIAILRTLDPGFELSYHLFRFSHQMLRKMIQTMSTKLKNIPMIQNLLNNIKSTLKIINRNGNLVPDHTGLVPNVIREESNYKLVRYFYPGGLNYFGPTCISSFGKTAELRTVKDEIFQVPVVPFKATGNSILYQEYNPKLGKISDEKLKMGGDNILRRIGFFIDQIASEGGDLRVLQNYHMNFNTVHWRKKLLRTVENDANSPNKVDALFEGAKGNGDEVPSGSSRFETDQVMQPSSSQSITPTGSVHSNPKLDITPEHLPELVNPNIEKSILNLADKYKSTAPDKGKRLATDRKPDLNVLEKKPKLEVSDTNLDIRPGTSKDITANMDSEWFVAIARGVIRRFHSEYLAALSNFKEKGLSTIKKDRESIKFLRLLLANLAFLEMNTINSGVLKPSSLWYTQIINRPKVIQYLKNLKGGTFFFNDITLLTDIPPAASVGETSALLSSNVEVRYHLTINSEYGFVDLSKFHQQFTGDYVVFNDVQFKVTDTFFNDKNNILVIKLKSQELPKENWFANRNLEVQSLIKREKILSTRMESIHNAANFMVDNVPCCTYKIATEMLMKYILKLKPSQSVVPTYEKFATDYYNNMKILPSYKSWTFPDWKYINDLLFEDQLDDIQNVVEASYRIEIVYDLLYKQNIEDVYAKYSQKLMTLKRLIRFEDFYVLYSKSIKNFEMNYDNLNRYAVSIYSTILRQAHEEWIKTPITIYSGKIVPETAFKKFSLYKKLDHIKFINFKQHSTIRDEEFENIIFGSSTSSQKGLFFEIEIKNQAGLLDLSYLSDNLENIHIVTPEMVFIVDEVESRIISGQEILFVKMHDFEVPTEKRMIDVAERLDELYSTGTDFYYPE
ncbi:uncharacterized protein LOC122512866 [Leptopilina heterotoma]|uniref:uncharacterized protein LOC122512866 n=1 Tax=Leptopilina heterotoma TaxID=63436 RepID=UPI001CA803D6|nr:uncharacterized protein LOC122512866 [Leptopilina heterotoma]